MTSSISKAEKSYIQAGLRSTEPQRQDGRKLDTYRPISLETGVAPLANGSARLSIGRGSTSVTEVLAAVKLQVESVGLGESDKGNVVCAVSWYALLFIPCP